MTNIQILLKELRAKGILLNYSEENLEMLQINDLEIDADDINLVKANKEAIIGYLKGTSKKSSHTEILQVQPQEDYAVSSSQKRIWILSQFSEASVAYNMPFHTRLGGDYHIESLIKAVETVVDRHEVLRTVFIQTPSDEIRQKVLTRDELQFNVAVIDFLKEEDKDLNVQNYIKKDSYSHFDLEKGPLVRASILQISDLDFVFYFNMHHIISDGESLNILIKEILACHDAYKNGSKPVLKELAIQYKEYAAWQKKKLEEGAFAPHQEYWKNKFSGENSILNLPTKKVRPNLMGHSGHCLGAEIPSSLAGKLKKICQEQDATLFMGLLASWNIMLYRYTSQRDIIIGSPVSGRYHTDLRDQIGFYVNTILFKNTIDSQKNFVDFLSSIKESALEAYNYQEYPFDVLLEELQIAGDTSRNKLFDVLLVLQESSAVKLNLPKDNAIADRGNRPAKLDIEIIFHNTADGLFFEIIYNTEVYEKEMVSNLITHYLNLLENILAEPAKEIGNVDFLLEQEKKQILEVFNGTKTDYPENQTVIDLFKQQLKENPDNIAVVFEGNQLTFKELDQLSGQLANYLSANYDLEDKQIIAVKLYRSEWMLVSILAILRMGKAYVPIDPDYPEKRIEYIKEDSNYALSIDENKIKAFQKQQDTYSGFFQEPVININDLAYVIFTSGSTGIPKGVMNSHAGLFNRLMWMRDDLNITQNETILQKTQYTFDVSVWELIMPLITGCKLVFSKPEGHKDPIYLQDIIKENKISLLHFVPSMLGVFLLDVDSDKCRSLKHVVCSGESLPVAVLKEFKEKLPQVRIHNYYGPTEAAIDVTAIDLTEQDTITRVSIGTPVANTSIYIANEELRLQPVGVAGELIIGGVQVAQGYMNRPELNLEKFIQSPFKKGERLYRTGDLACWLPDGNIEYIGRIDNQVKIRGNRIEIGEIESVLEQSGLVKQCVVLIKKDKFDNQNLIGYILEGENYKESGLLDYLRGNLPDYMIPSLIISVPEMPTTSNGKVDRAKLPEPDFAQILTQEYIAPRNKTELALAAVWESTLKIEKIGVYDNFFQMGGDSIVSIRLISAINKALNTSLRVDQLYKNQSIADLAVAIEAEQNNNIIIERYLRTKKDIENLRNTVLEIIANPEAIEEVYPMSDIQKGMVFSSVMNPEKAIYHDQFVYQIPKADIDLLNKSMALMIEKHAILRTAFELEIFEEQFQIVYKTIDFEIDVQDISAVGNDSQQNEITAYILKERNRAFDFSKAPLWRCTIFNLNNSTDIFLFQFHHSILDGWSVASFNTELFEIYGKLQKENDYKPQKLAYDYKESVIQEIAEKENEKSIAFWNQELSDYKRLAIFSDVQSPDHYRKIYDKALLKDLREKTKKDGLTLKTVLFGAYALALKMLTYDDDIVLGLVSNNRPIVEDGDKILGCFLNTLPIRINFEKYKTTSWNDYFLALEQEQINLKEHERLTLFEISKNADDRSNNENPFFDVIFDYIDFHVYDAIANENTEHSFSSDQSYEATNTALDLTLSATGGVLSFDYRLRKKLTVDVSLERLHNYVENILNQYLDFSDRKMDTSTILTEEERTLLLQITNKTECAAYSGTYVDVFNDQVQKNPADTALIFEGKIFAYRELDQLVNQFSGYLKENHNVQENDLVGIMVERSEWLIISMLAVIKLGAAYIPIDGKFPESRKQYIKEDSNYKLCIENAHIEEFIPQKNNYAVQNISAAISPDNLLYIIYTSGTTGNPKGVKVTHANLVSFLDNFETRFAFFGLKRIGATTNITFDISILEILGALGTGKELYLFSSEDLIDPDRLMNTVASSEIEIIQMTPSRLMQLYETGIPFPNNLKLLLVGGEAMDEAMYNRLKAEHFDSINVYGPTETTIWSSSLNVKQSEGLSIGSPLVDESIYILDSHNYLQPQGVIGEICISGLGVSNGYLNKDDLTAEKFIDNPFKKGEKLYKTGDLGKRLSNGNIAFLGRKDDQIKIRGYRIELGEIENALLKDAAITSALVRAVKPEGKELELVAYIIAQREIQVQELKAFLREYLSEHMIPLHIIQMEAFPLTMSGKVDRKQLPLPEEKAIVSGANYTAPRNDIENKLVMIWGTILNLNASQIGIDNAFFELGGNSITIMKLRNEIRKEFKKEVAVAALFQNPTIRLQVEFILEEKQKNVISDEEINTLDFSQDGNQNSDIAVIGMAVKIPGANNIADFWENLQNGTESISHFSEEELKATGVSKLLLKNKNYVRANSYMENREFFDASFFGYLPDEAKLMDPQTRILHEVVWSALEDAACDPFRYKGLIGLFTGARTNVNWQAFSMLSNNKIDEYTAAYLRDKDFASSLIAHKLNLKGGANAINTACSTSLVAIHQACTSLLSGNCTVALAGGVSINSIKKEGYLYQDGMIMSQDGHNRTFDSSASGTVNGEGAGVVVLKKLSDALKDGDNIISIIKGSAINNDGSRKVGFTAPSVDGQIEVIKMAQRRAGVQPDEISYVEAHGTATKLGDPIEVEALSQIFGFSENKYCALGSVKSNIGHLDAAAGIAGFIKTALCLKNKKLVPSLHFNELNPNINFENTPFYVSTALKTWESESSTLKAGVSSFGIGGTNAHVILQEPPAVHNSQKKNKNDIIVLSAKTEKALDNQLSNLVSFLNKNQEVSVEDLSWTLQKGRSQFDFRAALVNDESESLADKIQSGIKKNIHKAKAKSSQKLVFMYPGQGTQYINMAKGLYEDEFIFRKEMDSCLDTMEKITGESYKNVLFPDSEEGKDIINQTKYAQPLLFSIEYALTRLLNHYGVKPDILIGHSIGEYTAACISGVLALEDALSLVIHRGKIIQRLPKGSMLSVDLSASKVTEHLRKGVSIAAVNTQESCVLSGEDNVISELYDYFEQNGIKSQKLKTSHAFHSEMMLPGLKEYAQKVSEITVGTPAVPYYSNLTGKLISSSDLENAAYWSDHILKTVNFSAALQDMMQQDNLIFIEVGPGKTLSNFVRQHQQKSISINVLRHPKEEEEDKKYFASSIAKLWTNGVNIDWDQFHADAKRQKISLPTYPFEKTKYSIGEDVYEIVSNNALIPKMEKNENISEWTYEPSWKKIRLTADETVIEDHFKYLFFADSSNVTSEVIKKIQDSQNVIKVSKGIEFTKVSDQEYIINPESYNDYASLFRTLKEQGFVPNKIGHLWNVSASEEINILTREYVSAAFKEGYYSLLHIAKSIGEFFPSKLIDIMVVSSGVSAVTASEVINPVKGAIIGVVATIPKEYLNVNCKHVDIDISSGLDNPLITNLYHEVFEDKTVKSIALRGRDRWVEFYGAVKYNPVKKEPVSIKKDSVYLITGGIGGMGLAFGKYLIENFNAKLILVGRREETPEVTSKLKEFGGEVLYISADISETEDLRLKVTQAEAILGNVQGVIHTAGVIDYAGIIQNRLIEENEKVFASKVYGTLALHEIFKDKNLDFMILCSSISSYAAPFGEVGYTSACIFQNKFAQHFSNTAKEVISIGWDTWSDTGMALEAVKNMSAIEKEQSLNHGISTEEGLEVFHRLIANTALRQTVSDFIVSTRNIEMFSFDFNNYLNFSNEIETDATAAIETLLDLDESATQTERRILELFSSFFGHSGIGLDDDFFELGGDSLKAMSFINQLNRILKAEISLVDFFNNCSARALASFLDKLDSVEKNETTSNEILI